MELGRVTVVKAVADNGRDEIITCEYSDGLTLVEALGMLTFATLYTPDYFEGESELGGDGDDYEG